MFGFKSGPSPSSPFVSLRAKRSNPGKRETSKRLLRHFVPRNDKASKQCVTKVSNEYTPLLCEGKVAIIDAS